MDKERFEKLKQREAELVSTIKLFQKEFLDKCIPVAEELQTLRESRADYWTTTDGSGFYLEYIGPLPTYDLPAEKLEKARKDGER